MDSELWTQLNEINNTIKDGLSSITDCFKQNTCTDMSDVLNKVKFEFYEALEEKTGWGKNQIKEIFEKTIDKVLNE